MCVCNLSQMRTIPQYTATTSKTRECIVCACRSDIIGKRHANECCFRSVFLHPKTICKYRKYEKKRAEKNNEQDKLAKIGSNLGLRSWKYKLYTHTHIPNIQLTKFVNANHKCRSTCQTFPSPSLPSTFEHIFAFLSYPSRCSAPTFFLLLSI